MARTAHLVTDDLGGHGHHARLYRLSEPFLFGPRQIPHEYVVVAITRPWLHVEGKVQLYPATPDGAGAEPSAKEYPGSFVLHDDPLVPPDEAKLEGAYTWSLGSLGYQIGEPDVRHKSTASLDV